MEHDLTTNVHGPWNTTKNERHEWKRNTIRQYKFTYSRHRRFDVSWNTRRMERIEFDDAGFLIECIRIDRAHVVARTSGSAMMFVGTSGVDSQMDMMHPMATDFVRSFVRSVRARALLLPRRTDG